MTNGKANEEARLVRAEVQNVLGIRLAEVTFDKDGGLLVVGGENGAGKSSLLDALRWALDGVKPKGKEMLRHGADKGTVSLKLAGQMVEIKRSVTEKGAYLKATWATGADVKSPQKVLDALIGTFGIDPTEFLMMNGEQQAKRVQEVMGVDFSDLDAHHKRLFEERTIANRRVRDAEGELRNLPQIDGDPVEPVVLSDLVARLEEAEKSKREHEENVALLEQVAKKATALAAEIDEATKRLASLRASRDEMFAVVQNGEAELIDTAPLREKLKDAEAINAKASAFKRRAEAEWKVKVLSTDVEKTDVELKSIAAERLARVGAAPCKVPGVCISDGVVCYDPVLDANTTDTDRDQHSLPISELSDGQRLRLAFEIAAAGAPDPKVMFLRHGSLLDAANRKYVAELAQERGYTVVMESVGDNEVDVLIEDGVSK